MPESGNSYVTTWLEMTLDVRVEGCDRSIVPELDKDGTFIIADC